MTVISKSVLKIRCVTLHTKELQCMYIPKCRPFWIHYSNFTMDSLAEQKTLDPDIKFFRS